MLTKRILMIIACNMFRDEEYQVPRQYFEKMGFKVEVASSVKSTCNGKLGLKVRPDILISEVTDINYDAIVFVGGIGAKEYFNDPVSHEIAKNANKHGKVVSAICIAPVILLNAGLLSGKKATAFPSEETTLKNGGALYSGKSVERDGKIVTANGPEAALEFARLIVDAIGG